MINVCGLDTTDQCESITDVVYFRQKCVHEGSKENVLQSCVVVMKKLHTSFQIS